MRPYLPAPGEIVWCNFPYYHGGEVKPGPKARPCLVLGVTRRLDGEHFITLAYGTSSGNAGKYPLAIRPSRPQEFEASGLFKETRFDLQNAAKLPWTPSFFPPVPAMMGRPARTNCFLGVLHPSTQDTLRHIMLAMRKDPTLHRVVNVVADAEDSGSINPQARNAVRLGNVLRATPAAKGASSTPAASSLIMTSKWMRGQCWDMAVALHRASGFPMHGLFDNQGLCHHAFVMMPDGRGLDYRGPQAIDQLVAGCAGQAIRPLEMTDIAKWLGRDLAATEIADASAVIAASDRLKNAVALGKPIPRQRKRDKAGAG